ncbi:hypothetical protein FRC12_006773 [Ceratobasidium sp. 428]|nr:hypothetical protein FRC12_006773 [Ceratobasidium sp. 428]
MDQAISKIEQNVKKLFKKLFNRPLDAREPSTASGLQGPSTQTIDVTHSQPALEPVTPLNPVPTTSTPSLRPEPSNAAQPPVANPSVPPITEHGATRNGWLGLKAFARVVSEGSELLGPLKPAIGGMLEVTETFELAAQNCEGYQRLRDELNALLHDLAGHFGSCTPLTMTPTIVNLAQGIERELETIRRKQDQSVVGGYIRADTDADQILEHYRGVQGLLQRLALNANIETWKIASEQAMETRLSKLPNSPTARYRSTVSSVVRDECTPNTRVKVLEELYEWARNSESPKIYWMNGMAGTGKTTIAYSLCKELEHSQGLAASFFCARQIQECREVNRIVPTISYQLSRFSLPFRAAVSQVLETDPDVCNQPVLDQFRQLILEPLLKANDALPTSLVVVVDALDECDDNRGAEILKSLLLYARDLPVKFFVASRSDASILDSMRRQTGDYTPVELRLHDLDRSTVEEDIRTYLRTKIVSHMQLSAAHFDILVKQSGVLFIYAATVVRYIESNNFSRATKRLKEVLASDSIGLVYDKDKGINALYSTILAAAFEGPDLNKSDRTDMKQILNTVVCAQEPLSVGTMAGMLGFDSETVRAALHPLLSVLQVSDTTQVITTLPESFSDYLLDKSRSDAFHCDPKKHNACLTQICFDRINMPNPPFNICGLESSYMFDKDVPDLSTRIKKAIPEELRYACHYWGVHIILAQDSQALAGMLLRFLSDRFLLWLEVVKLCEYIYDGVKALHRMQKWASNAGHLDESVKHLLRDVWMFVASFSSSPARLSTPHIYISTLTFWPDHSLIKKIYKQDSSKLIASASTAMNLRSTIPLSVQNTRSRVRSLSYSPDGTYVVSGSDDEIIRVWDAHTGQLAGRPLEGHAGLVNSVAYSPDGAYIVSGSDDKTVRIWDAQTYQPVGQPMREHTASITSVTYSPEGAYIVSGSRGGTMIIWDAHTYQSVELMEEHTNSVNTLAYSPNGAYIVSGSDDKTVRIWDTRTYQPVGLPMGGHTDSVNSVAYSPDGAYIVSSSDDYTICIWDARTRQPMGQSMRGHTNAVASVAYSPDGAYIVSGSHDHTMRIWDAHSCQPIGQPMEGHNNSVSTVAYSPDGAYIASGSNDYTIRVWDAHTRQPVEQSIEGHIDNVNSVVYSPNGAYIVSGSDDETIRIWDAQTYQPVGQPMGGHTDSVNTLAYSPDGTYIASGSQDGTIRIWDAQTFQQVGYPMQGSMSEVSSAVSSSSYSITADSVDAPSSQTEEPPEGHANSINSVAYSPDGAYIVSGSNDKTIRIWDTRTYQSVGEPLEGHTGSVNSVAYSPNGAYIISGSDDRIIRVWNAFTYRPVGKPLKKHATPVTSVAYSPDGRYIVSGSRGHTIRVWSIYTRQPVGQPLCGHADAVSCVTYSPDGAYVVSGSLDKTIRIWNAHTHQPVGQPLQGHTGRVKSVAYSSNGAYIVSGSEDETIRIWDTQSVIVPTSVIQQSRNDESRIAHSLRVVPEAESAEPLIACNLGCQNDCSHMAWTLNENGWIVFNSDKLIWVPPDLWATLLSPQGAAVLHRRGFLQLDLDRNTLGDYWCENFRPGRSVRP